MAKKKAAKAPDELLTWNQVKALLHASWRRNSRRYGSVDAKDLAEAKELFGLVMEVVDKASEKWPEGATPNVVLAFLGSV